MEQVHDALAQVIGRGDDFDDLLEMGRRICTRRRNQRIETDRGNLPAHGIDLDRHIAGQQEISIVSLPIKDEERLAVVFQLLDDPEDDVGLSRTASSKNGAVLDEFSFAQPKRCHRLLVVNHLPNLIATR